MNVTMYVHCMYVCIYAYTSTIPQRKLKVKRTNKEPQQQQQLNNKRKSSNIKD